MLKRWAIYRSEGGGVLTLLDVILAVDADGALEQAERLLPQEPTDRLRAMYQGPGVGLNSSSRTSSPTSSTEPAGNDLSQCSEMACDSLLDE